MIGDDAAYAAAGNWWQRAGMRGAGGDGVQEWLVSYLWLVRACPAVPAPRAF
jgi:hypothetical protein